MKLCNMAQLPLYECFHKRNRSVASCSKLTTSLVNNLLKFQMAILQIHLLRILTIFSTKITAYYAFQVDRQLTNLGLNESVKLTKF